jgi:hypothetical protein
VSAAAVALGRIAAIVLTCLPVEAASQAPAKAAALAGVSAVAIVVNPLHDEARKHGLSEAALRTIAEARLKTAGLRILSSEEYQSDSSVHPYVLVSLNVLVNPQGSYIFSVAVSARRMIRSPLNKEFVPAVFWESGGLGGGTGGGMQKNAEDYVGDIIDQLAGDVLKANPRK